MSEQQRLEMKSTAAPQPTRPLSVIYMLVLALGTFMSCQPKSLPTVWEVSDDIVTIKFSHQTSKAEIAKITQSLEQDFGVSLITDGSTYLENDRLQDLNMLIKTSAGNAGTASARLSNLQYTYYGLRLEQVDGQWRLVKIGNL